MFHFILFCFSFWLNQIKCLSFFLKVSKRNHKQIVKMYFTVNSIHWSSSVTCSELVIAYANNIYIKWQIYILNILYFRIFLVSFGDFFFFFFRMLCAYMCVIYLDNFSCLSFHIVFGLEQSVWHFLYSF